MRKYKQKNPQNKKMAATVKMSSIVNYLFCLFVCLFFYSKSFKTAEPIKPNCFVANSQCPKEVLWTVKNVGFYDF